MTGPTQNGSIARDDNDYPVMAGTSNVDNKTIINSSFDPITRRLLTTGSGGAASITVTDGVTTVTNVTTLDFTSGATITAGTTGVANVAITGGGSGTPGGLNTQLQYNNAGAFGGITGAVTDGTSVSLTAPHLLNPTINGAGTGLATLAYPNTSSSATITLPTVTGTLATLAGTETLTNKTLTSPSITGATITTSTVNGVTLTTGGGTTTFLNANGTYSTPAGAGTVTSVSVVTANGFAGTVATATSTPAITLTTSVTGVLKGNGTAISAATSGTDYSAGTSALATGILKSTTTTGALTIAVAADFPTLNQNTTGSAATLTTPRAINGVNFDGSAAITVTAAAGTLTGTTLNSTVVTSSITTLGTSASLPGSPTTTTQTPADNSTKIATTAYVDNAVLGQNYKEAALVATTANLVGVYVSGVFTYTATGTDNIDGVNLALGNRVLVKNQTTTFQNGIYTVTTAGAIGVAGVLTRSSDANTSGEFKTGDALFVTSGTVNASTTWAYTGIDSPTLGTDPITYVQVAGLGTYVAGNGLTLTGNSFSIDTSITVDKTTAQTLTNKSIVATQLTGTLQAGQFPALTGDITTTAGALATTLASVNSNVGSFTNANITVNGKGLITAASNGSATGLIIGTTTITSGTSTRMLYDNAGVVGETTGITTNGTVATLTTPVLTGLPTGTGVSASATASTLVARDANANETSNNFVPGYTTTVTVSGVTSTTLTVASTFYQYFTGTNQQLVVLPVASTLVLGQSFYIANLSTSNITIQTSSATSLLFLSPNTSALVTCILTSGTGIGSWNYTYNGLKTSVASTSAASLTVNTQLILSGSNNTTMTLPTTSATLARTDAGQTFTGTNAFGVITATTLNGNTFTTGTYTLTGTAAKTLNFTNSLTLSGTDSTTMTFPGTSATIARTDAAQTFTGVQTLSSAPVLSTSTITVGGNTNTFQAVADTVVYRATTDTLTNKRITRRTTTVTQSATPTINSDNMDVASITSLAQAITSMTTNLTGTPVQNDFLEIQITDNGTARAITWGTSFSNGGLVNLPTTTVLSTKLRVLLEWDATSKWTCVAVA